MKSWGQDNVFKGLLTALFLFAAAATLKAQDDLRWSLLLVSPADSSTVRFIRENGFDLLSVEKTGLRLLANPLERIRLDSLGIRYAVIEEDYGRFVAEAREEGPRPSATGIAVGSMGGFFSPDEIAAFVDSLVAADRHGIISERFEFGRSVLDRPLWAVRVAGDRDPDGERPRVLYNSLIHSREGVTVMVLLNYLAWLVENYGRVDSVTSLVDGREMYFIPLLNPDGYEINWQSYRNSSPGRFGNWRKNARDNNQDGTLNFYDGVDLNRNFDYKWGYDDTGSSPLTFVDNYRGPSAFSEPETRAVRDFINSQNFVSAVNFHSYGSVLINPWGYNASVQPPDAGLYARLGKELTRENRYPAGNVNQTLGGHYLVNGEFTDWQYGDSLHPKIMAWSMEIGEERADGFWPSVSRIEYLCGLNLPFCYSLARLSGFEPRFDSTFTSYVSDDSSEVALGVSLTNTGFLNGGGRARLEIESLDPFIHVYGDSVNLPELPLDSVLTVPAETLRARFTGKSGSGRVRLVVWEGDYRNRELEVTVSRPVGRFYDLDGDGRVSVFDLLALLRRLSGGPVAGQDDSLFDLDDNGRVDIFDLLALLRQL